MRLSWLRIEQKDRFCCEGTKGSVHGGDVLHSHQLPETMKASKVRNLKVMFDKKKKLGMPLFPVGSPSVYLTGVVFPQLFCS
jgi:hypothetical protein